MYSRKFIFSAGLLVVAFVMGSFNYRSGQSKPDNASGIEEMEKYSEAIAGTDVSFNMVPISYNFV